MLWKYVFNMFSMLTGTKIINHPLEDCNKNHSKTKIKTFKSFDMQTLAKYVQVILEYSVS